MPTVDDFIERVQALPEALLDEGLKECSRAVYKVLARSISAGETPTGQKWAPSKLTGEAVLTNAVSALRTATIGRVIYIRLLGVEARHHRGAVKGRIKRQMIPTNETGVTPAISAAMIAVLRDKFEGATSG